MAVSRIPVWAGVLMASLSFLSACSLQQLQHRSIEGEDYLSALAREYRAYAEARSEQGSWRKAAYFARKGLRAAQGENVLPETPADWDIPQSLWPRLQEALAELEYLRTAGLAEEQPTEMARATLLYDCWIEQLADGIAGETSVCATEFANVVNALAGKHPEIQERAIGLDGSLLDHLASRYRVFFRVGSTALGEKGMEVIRHIVSLLESESNITLNIYGYADKSGSKAYNAMLAEQRARAVRDAFINAGIPEAMLTTQAYGESEALIETDDGLHEWRNRRVDIQVVRDSH